MSLRHKTTRTARALALGATLTVLVAGCGSSNNKSSASTAAPATSTPASTSTAAAAPAKSGPVAIAYKDFAISPANVTVKAGTKIVWTNDDATTHNVVVKPGAPAAYKSADFGQGKTATFTPTKPGVYKYLCTFHPASMQGTITVTG